MTVSAAGCHGLSADVQDDVRAGLVSITVAREVARLPRGNQGVVTAAIHHHGLTTRDAAGLVSLFERAPGAEEQRYLVEHPREALEADGARDARGQVPGARGHRRLSPGPPAPRRWRRSPLPLRAPRR